MTTDIAVPEGVSLTATGAKFMPDLAYEDWAEIGDRLASHEASFLWVVGDWMIYGAEHYGAKAIQLAAATGLTERTVYNATSVCRRVDRSVRREELSFKHHDAVAAQTGDMQEALLQLAVDECLSASALADRVRAYNDRDDEPRPSGVTAGGKSRPIRFNLSGIDDVPDEILERGVHKAAETLRDWLADQGYEISVAEVL